MTEVAKEQRGNLIDRLRRAVLVGAEANLTDGQLLECFVGRRDEAAVAVLVRRHGPMVWGVCRRVLHNHQDAEDAFQATFLVLVRKAASVRPREAVGNWLYGVAHTTALKARATAAKRHAREKQVSEMPEPEAVTEPDPWHGVEPLLDQELSHLPDKYRTVIVLCDLEGKTPALPTSPILPLGNNPCRGEVLAILVAPSLGRWFLGTTRRLAIAADHYLACDLSEHPRPVGRRRTPRRPTSALEGAPTIIPA